MGNTAKKTEDMTLADIRAMFAEAAEMAKANEKSLKDFNAKLDRMVEEHKLEIEERRLAAKERILEMEERKLAAKEHEKEHKLELQERILAAKEREKVDKEHEKTMKKLEEIIEKTSKSIFGMNQELKGISDSNGMMAEEYFYNSLDESMSFGGYHFDSVDRNRKRKCRDKDGNPIQTEYDVLMTNADASCIVEVKYRARRDHIEDLLEKVGKFRLQFANCANHKIILGIAALSFDDGVENEAKKLGMGILKLNGDAVEVYDKNLKVY